jgi:hypothetical protein
LEAAMLRDRLCRPSLDLLTRLTCRRFGKDAECHAAHTGISLCAVRLLNRHVEV